LSFDVLSFIDSLHLSVGLGSVPIKNATLPTGRQAFPVLRVSG